MPTLALALGETLREQYRNSAHCLLLAAFGKVPQGRGNELGKKIGCLEIRNER